MLEGIMVRLKYTQKTLQENGKNPETIRKVKLLLKDDERIPVWKEPISTIARATLIICGVESDIPEDNDLQRWKEILLDIKKEYDHVADLSTSEEET